MPLTIDSTYLIFGCFCFTMFFFVWFFVPETKGMSLEAMDKLFGVTDDGKDDLVGGPDNGNEHDNEKTATSQVEISGLPEAPPSKVG